MLNRRAWNSAKLRGAEVRDGYVWLKGKPACRWLETYCDVTIWEPHLKEIARIERAFRWQYGRAKERQTLAAWSRANHLADMLQEALVRAYPETFVYRPVKDRVLLAINDNPYLMEYECGAWHMIRLGRIQTLEVSP